MDARDASAALEQLFDLSVRLVDAMDGGLSARGLTRARGELIWRLRLRGPMTQRELSQMLRCTPRNVTGLVDALQADGFVMRSPHPTDRRATLVTLTEQGGAAAASWQSGYQELAARLFTGLAAADLARFKDTLDRMLEQLEDGTAVTPSATADEPR
jgi:DNA-binding MarR family transcriptional regulator